MGNREGASDVEPHPDIGERLRRHDPMMRAVAYRIVGQTVLDDVMQDAYLRAIRSYPSFEGRSSFRTWLYQIVRNTCIDHIRSSKRTVHTVSDELLPVEPADHDGFGPVDLEAAVASLPLEQREALTLSAIVGLDYRETAELLGVPPGTVASRVHRARAALERVIHEAENS